MFGFPCEVSLELELAQHMRHSLGKHSLLLFYFKPWNTERQNLQLDQNMN